MPNWVVIDFFPSLSNDNLISIQGKKKNWQYTTDLIKILHEIALDIVCNKHWEGHIKCHLMMPGVHFADYNQKNNEVLKEKLTEITFVHVFSYNKT